MTGRSWRLPDIPVRELSGDPARCGTSRAAGAVPPWRAVLLALCASLFVAAPAAGQERTSASRDRSPAATAPPAAGIAGWGEATGAGWGEPSAAGTGVRHALLPMPLLSKLSGAETSSLAEDFGPWVDAVRIWALATARTLFGPRGIVRAGEIPDSEQNRVRLELTTEPDPGIQFVVIPP